MAFITGTATNAADFYSKLIAFLTTDADLLAANQQWEIVWDTPAPGQNATDKVLRGPGLSEQDQVYIGLRLFQDVSGDSYYIACSGMTGILPNGQHYRDHVNVSPDYVRMFLDVGTITYWFVASGRRFMVAAKISTVFEAMYAGLFLPYATPDSYSYPLFIGGSAGSNNGTVDSPSSWRSEAENHSHFVTPYYMAPPGQAVETGAWLLDPAGSWQRVSNNGDATPIRIGPENTDGTYFSASDASATNFYGAAFIMSRTMDCYGGSRTLWPCHLIQTSPTDQTYGILDGAYRCQGIGNAAENIITVDGLDHLVIQNAFRTSFNDYWAMALPE